MIGLEHKTMHGRTLSGGLKLIRVCTVCRRGPARSIEPVASMGGVDRSSGGYSRPSGGYDRPSSSRGDGNWGGRGRGRGGPGRGRGQRDGGRRGQMDGDYQDRREGRGRGMSSWDPTASGEEDLGLASSSSRYDGQQRRYQQRVLSDDMAAVNESIKFAATWRELQQILEVRSRGGEGGLDPFQLVAILLAANKFRTQKNADEQADFNQFIATVYGWVLDRIDRFRPRQLAGALQSVGQLQLYNEELVSALLARCTTQFTSFQPADMARLLRALSKLGVVPDPDWVDMYFTRTYTTRDSFNRFQKYSAGDLVTSLTSLNALGLKPPPEWMAAFVEAAAGQLREMSSRDYVALLLALAAAGWRPGEGDRELVGALVGRSFPLLTYMNALELSQVAWALAQYGVPLDPQWGQAFHQRLRYVGRSASMTPALTSSILYSCVYLGNPPPPPLLADLLNAMARRYDDATGDDMGGVAMALAQFQYMPEQRWMDDFLITLRSKLPTTTAAGLTNITAALPSFGNGVRLRECVADAQARLDAMAAAADAAAAADLYAAEPAAPQEQQSMQGAA